MNAEFLAMTLVIVYVGAIAVLFLFVVMMLNISESVLKGRLFKIFSLWFNSDSYIYFRTFSGL